MCEQHVTFLTNYGSLLLVVDQSFGILTEPNNTKPNLIVHENKDIPLFFQFYINLIQHLF